MYNIQGTLGVKSMSDLTIKTIKDIFKTKTLIIEQIRNNKRYGKEFIDDLTGTYIHEDLILSITMDCRTPTAIKLSTKLEFNQDDLIATKK